MDDEVLLHYGVKRRSGRYPWGSGDDPYQKSDSILRKVDDLRDQNFTEKEIATKLGMNTSELRSAIALAGEERKKAIMDTISSMKKDGSSNAEITRVTGIPEATVRNYISNKDKVKTNQISEIATTLKDTIKDTPYLDVGVGVERDMGISRSKLKNAIAKLEEEGYHTYDIYVPQVTNSNNKTTVKVLTKDPTLESVVSHRSEIKPPLTFSDDGGLTFQGLKPIKNVSWDRVGIKYGDKGGVDRDGIVQIRRGVKDLDLGANHYAQVRIKVGGTHFVKGLAMYSDDMPDGVDILFNTNKPSGTPKDKVFKKLKDNPDNPFGATIKPQGQKGAINIVNEEGDWNSWSGSKFSAQFLSKQPLSLVKERVGDTYKSVQMDYADILKLTNPIVKKHLLEEFASDAESKARHLKVNGIPKTKAHVLIPFPDMKPNEIYAPNYNNGDRVVLIRYPHAGTFEIPELTVNNKYKPAKKALGNVTDGIGIHPSVAHKLSGADFDGDVAYVIPNNNKKIKATSSLAGLKDFDPNVYQVDHKTISPRKKQTMMGEVSNLITDMTVKGASTSEITRAVRHSMVVIDSEKHNLDWKASAADNGISALRKKYQNRPSYSYDKETKQLVKGRNTTGASTLVSRSKTEVETAGVKSTFTDAQGHIRTVTKNQKKEPLVNLIDDAYKLSSGSAVENVYADYINKLKALSNSAQKEANHIPNAKRSKEASLLYSKEVKSLETKLNVSLANAPRERRAQIIANDTYSKNVKVDMEPDQKKKLKSQALAAGRVKAGAKRKEVTITDTEWEAIQAGALTNNMLELVLKNANADRVRELATPRPTTKLSSAKISRAKVLLDRGYTQAQVAASLGVSTSTLNKEIGGS